MSASGASAVGRSLASRLVVARALVRLTPRETTVTLVAVLALGCAAMALWPLQDAGPSTAAPTLEVARVQVVRPPQADRIDAVLARRGPGLGLRLREQLAHAIAEEARVAGFDPLLVLAIIQVESEFLESAVSNMGARGLMQIQPVTLQFIAQREGIRLTPKEIESDPALRVRLGIRYLKYLASRFGNDLDLALMAYNAGPTRVYMAMKTRELEQFRNYVRAVRREYAGLKLEHGESGDWAFAARETPLEARQ
ncbi:MAG: lytic transglycosylase domain-containing protein [Myxococcaceae bacterium]|nr:lytic transglycosylase domain-containing protein [Myxococcaceae bacterium]